MTSYSDLVGSLAARPWIGVLLAYALGCLNTGYYLVHVILARDIRQVASGNAGATNVGRVLGHWGFGLTLLGDLAKGALAVFGAQSLGWSEPWQAAILCAVVVGHNWPVQLRFRGGKGVAASCGALLWFDPVMLVALLGLLFVIFLSIRRRVLSGMIVYALIPFAALLFRHQGASAILLATMASVIIFSHRKKLGVEIFRTSATVNSPANPPPLQCKIATEPWEFEAIHRLNHQTFAREIPQHAPASDGRLVDRFHSENTYVIAVRGRQLVGMMALRGRRPFSLDAKVPDLDRHIPPGHRPVEVRLLAVEPSFRHTAVFTTLFTRAAKHCLEAGFDIAVISGTTRQLKLYRHLGFAPFGPLVGTAAALYQPMFLTLETFTETVNASAKLRESLSAPTTTPKRPLNFLPGPVSTTPDVDRAFATPPLSHRSPEFLAQMRDVQLRLCELTGAPQVQIIPGSGSLANAIVAAQLSLENTSGLVISNGEFGERLIAEARRAQLRFTSLCFPWGTGFDLTEVAARSARVPRGGWIWFVHHETSTGVLNPLDAINAIATQHGLRLCVDAISSIGTQAVDLKNVALATGTSGKGLCGYPGLALVFHNYNPPTDPARLPGYLDLGHWAVHASVPYTHSSNLLSALATALHAITPARMARIRENASWLRASLRAQGFALVAPDGTESSGIVSIALDESRSSDWFGGELERRGFSLSFRSGHLLARNWIQIALFGDPPRHALQSLLASMQELSTKAERLQGVPSAPCSTPVLATV